MGKRFRDRRNMQTVSAYTMQREMRGSSGNVSAVVEDQVGDDLYGPIGHHDRGSFAEYTPYDMYGSDLNYTTQTGSVGSMGSNGYGDEYPGSREDFHAEFENAVESDLAPNPQLVIRDNIDWTIGGQMGVVNRFPYSTGDVESGYVENFDLTGEQIYLRRETEARQLYGPVGTSDSNALLALAYAQMQNQYYPNEASQADLIRSV